MSYSFSRGKDQRAPWNENATRARSLALENWKRIKILGKGSKECDQKPKSGHILGHFLFEIFGKSGHSSSYANRVRSYAGAVAASRSTGVARCDAWRVSALELGHFESESCLVVSRPFVTISLSLSLERERERESAPRRSLIRGVAFQRNDRVAFLSRCKLRELKGSQTCLSMFSANKWKGSSWTQVFYYLCYADTIDVDAFGPRRGNRIQQLESILPLRCELLDLIQQEFLSRSRIDMCDAKLQEVS